MVFSRLDSSTGWNPVFSSLAAHISLTELEAEQTDLKQVLHDFFNESTDSIWAKDTKGKYLLINPAGARFLGKSCAEIIGKYDNELFPRETAH